MSPNVGNFVHDLVEMAKAMETLPQVEYERDNLKAEVDRLSQSVQDRELRIVDYKAEIEALQSKVRATEAERDDAELRFLELDEKAHKALGMLEMVEAYAKDAQRVIEPPKPQPEPEAQPQPPVSVAVHSIEPQPQGQGETSPTGEQPHGSPDTTSPAPQSPASQDQREINPPVQPSASTSDTPNDAGQAPATTTGVGSTGGEGSNDKPQSYAGKRYYDYPTYVSFQDWMHGGGTEADYNWRPEPHRSPIF